jgi:hypothetical protein
MELTAAAGTTQLGETSGTWAVRYYTTEAEARAMAGAVVEETSPGIWRAAARRKET